MTLSRNSPMPKRTKPMAKRRPTPRRFKSPRCQVRGCSKKAEVHWNDGVNVSGRDIEVYGMPAAVVMRMFCHSHARREALRRWSLAVRTGKCELAAFHAQYGVQCAGANVAGHGFGKGAYPGVMFEEWNGFSKCSGLNAWVEEHTLEWDGYLREVWGDKYEERRQQAITVRKYDLAAVLARYSA